MKTVKQRNMANRELKLAIGDELQNLFHPIVNATKQAAEETRKELEPLKETLTGIDGALNRSAPQPSKGVDSTFGIYRRGDGKLVMGNKVVQSDENKKTLTADDTVYDFTPGLYALIMLKHPRISQWPSGDYQAYRSLCAQTKVRLFPNSAGAARPHATWKCKKMLRKMVVPGEKIVEEEYEDSEDTGTASIGDIGESLSSDSSILSPGSPTHTRSYGKANKTKDREPFYKCYECEGVVYIPGDINGFTKKL